MEFPKAAPLAIAALRNMQSDKAISLDNSAIGISNAAALATAMVAVGELARYIARADTRQQLDREQSK